MTTKRYPENEQYGNLENFLMKLMVEAIDTTYNQAQNILKNALINKIERDF